MKTSLFVAARHVDNIIVDGSDIVSYLLLPEQLELGIETGETVIFPPQEIETDKAGEANVVDKFGKVWVIGFFMNRAATEFDFL